VLRDEIFEKLKEVAEDVAAELEKRTKLSLSTEEKERITCIVAGRTYKFLVDEAKAAYCDVFDGAKGRIKGVVI